mmetsp:Transcript_17487/g.39481  ORF Transcript_17487/g.39481 Transcript_17487/m.39481 type:complete len:187 (+) Transcript_17487:291-851(+)|eukprot:CAMPEP_0113309398 /NCGR_PEP_ID=MMETSP0010_2-20120614/7462_1 /TAXON_ID=216773 ORGANISM="Corethron hystrix, Strain 308" /NCGR_SAMPLE_ID=MMETSP0010_2 /ASSEMBLY_ACC=CAM_ASM_000155 /LENGTH=186 /DNA_ID=CAMNT_0000164651 /DNA_START=322 /DNA_END=882 /DNA_ORIENTATION=+ /assembly_acc=CAM_ASM_000155
MTRYSHEPDNATKSSKSRGSHLRIHYKHCCEITSHIKGMQVTKAAKFLDDVLVFKAIVPFTNYTGGIGRKAMCKQNKKKGTQGRWPVKATAVIRDLLSNAVANAETKGLDTDLLYVQHAQANRAPPGRRRTYRAHGRIGKYASEPAHVEIVLCEKAPKVAAEEDEQKKITRKVAAKNRFVKVGGGN